MPVRVSSLLPVLLPLCFASLDAQPLRLGSTRGEVMQQVYRAGAFADTLREGSPLIDQLQGRRRTDGTEFYVEAIRIAPVRLFDIDGFGQFLFDSDGRLVHYAWVRQNMTEAVLGAALTREYALGAAWAPFVDWKSDVAPGTYKLVVDQLRQVKPRTRWSGVIKGIHATLWKDSIETMCLDWNNGALTFYHHLKR